MTQSSFVGRTFRGAADATVRGGSQEEWLFSRSPRGAEASANPHSLIHTAKANRREPYWYLRELFKKLPHARIRVDHPSPRPSARPPPPAS